MGEVRDHYNKNKNMPRFYRPEQDIILWFRETELIKNTLYHVRVIMNENKRSSGLKIQISKKWGKNYVKLGRLSPYATELIIPLLQEALKFVKSYKFTHTDQIQEGNHV